jgi:hypothetical protein
MSKIIVSHICTENRRRIKEATTVVMRLHLLLKGHISLIPLMKISQNLVFFRSLHAKGTHVHLSSANV